MKVSALRAVHRRRLRTQDFTIIADDCWGSGVYQHLGLPYSTPLVGTLVPTPDFVHLVEDLPRLLRAPLEGWHTAAATTWGNTTTYPVASLGGEVRIEFIHYASREEAERKWARRLERVRWDRVFVKSAGDTRAHPCTIDHLRRLDALPYPTVCFTVKEHPTLRTSVPLQMPVSNGAMQVLPSLHDFDVVGWLNGGDGRPSTGYHLLDKALNGSCVPPEERSPAQLEAQPSP
jgi:uncharacterized protein (DUF1919 family)